MIHTSDCLCTTCSIRRLCEKQVERIKELESKLKESNLLAAKMGVEIVRLMDEAKETSPSPQGPERKEGQAPIIQEAK